MGKNRIQRIVPHMGSASEMRVLAQRISEFHAEIIERRLVASGLSTEGQIAVIDGILGRLNAKNQEPEDEIHGSTIDAVHGNDSKSN